MRSSKNLPEGTNRGQDPLSPCHHDRDAVGVDTPIMDALVEMGGAIMGKDCWAEGRNLEKMGLEGLDLEQIKVYLESAERPETK